MGLFISCGGLIVGFFVVVALVLFWLTEVVDLMGRRDEELPGRFDKAIWAAVMVLAGPLGCVAYWLWKRGGFVAQSPDSLRRELAEARAERAAERVEGERSHLEKLDPGQPNVGP